MRIGITCYPSVGGSGILATALGEELARCGHEVHFISYERPFRMPANADLSTGTRAGVRKPPKNETAGTRAPGGSACAMENWLAPLPGHGPEDVGTAVDASDGHEN